MANFRRFDRRTVLLLPSSMDKWQTKRPLARFVPVLLPAREFGVLQLDTMALDGTKIHGNASRHSALSYAHAGKACPRS
jgi:hypothetical protein